MESPVAVVTGASRGIGREVAKRLANDGFRIVVGYASQAEPAQALVAEINASGGAALSLKVDVADEGEVAHMFDAAVDRFGRVDVVVNSAGIMELGLIADADMAMFDRVVAVNLRGAYAVMAQAAKRVNEGGRIIAFSSSVIAKSLPRYGAYIAVKAGVEGLVRVLANELRGRRITVNAVAPGPVATELFLRGKSQDQIDAAAQQAPLQRLGETKDIAGVVSFLAGPDGGWVNAQVVRANGGFA